MNKPIPADGGVMVSLGTGFYGGGGNFSNQIVQPSWRYKVGTQLVAPASVVEVAPGLAVYSLPPSGSSMTLVDDKKKDLITVTRGPDEPKLAAPTVKAVEHTVIKSGTGYRSWESRNVSVELASAAPPNAFAMIIYVDGKAVSWGRTNDPTTKIIPVYNSPGRCSLQVPGQAEPPVGAKVTVAWIDFHGRVSPQSKQLVVRAGKAQPNSNQVGP